MLAPHELKNKSFTKTLKGYNPAEVDEYIAFLLDKYAEAYKENNELDHKLRVVVTNLDEIKDEEESIRSTLISAQKMAQNIIADANEKADVITGAVKDRCDAVIAEFKEQLRAEKEEMWELRTRIVDFKKQLFDQYRGHLQAIKDVSVNEIDEIVLPNEDAVVTQIFKDVKQGIEDGTHDDEDDGLEIRPVGSHFSAEDAPELTGEAAEAEDEYLRYMLEGNENAKGAQNGGSENADAEE